MSTEKMLYFWFSDWQFPWTVVERRDFSGFSVRCRNRARTGEVGQAATDPPVCLDRTFRKPQGIADTRNDILC